MRHKWNPAVYSGMQDDFTVERQCENCGVTKRAVGVGIYRKEFYLRGDVQLPAYPKCLPKPLALPSV